MERYKRQIGLIGEEGQKKLAEAKVLIVGAGGLGNIASKFLASSGVGHIRIADNDVVDRSNLHRQLLFNEECVNVNKANALTRTLERINPYIRLSWFELKIQDARDIHKGEYDVILDCTDNMEASYYLEEKALLNNIPLVFAKTSKWFGVVKVIRDKEYLKNNYPTKQLNKDNSVFPPIGGLVGSYQASMALKLILGKKVSEETFHFDILNDKFINYNK